VLLDEALEKRGDNGSRVDGVIVKPVDGRVLSGRLRLYEVGFDGVDAPIEKADCTGDGEDDAGEDVVTTQAVHAELPSVHLGALADTTPEDVRHVHDCRPSVVEDEKFEVENCEEFVTAAVCVVVAWD